MLRDLLTPIKLDFNMQIKECQKVVDNVRSLVEAFQEELRNMKGGVDELKIRGNFDIRNN